MAVPLGFNNTYALAMRGDADGLKKLSELVTQPREGLAARVSGSAGNLERSNLGNLLQEISLAYNLGDVAAARKTMQVGKLKTTKWVLKFDILKAEQISENKKGIDGRAIGGLLSMLGGLGGSGAGAVAGSVQTQDASGVWLIGMRYKIMNANTTEQVAQGYKELKMEVGSTQTSVLGVSDGAKGGVGIDTMVQRLVQTAVWDIPLCF